MNLSRVTTRDVLAVMTVAASLVFNGISLASNRPIDAATMALAGAVIGYYFKQSREDGSPVEDDGPLAAPFTGDGV